MRAKRAPLNGEAAVVLGTSRNLFAIHRGRALLGNIGSTERLIYTAVDDNVGLTWRLKQLNHLYGTRIIISNTVQREVAEQFWFRWLDRVQVHAGTEQMDLFELLGPRTEALDPTRSDFAHRYEQGLNAVLAGDWKTADEAFRHLTDVHPDDRSVQLMSRRCQIRNKRLCPIGDDANLFSELLI